MLSYILLFVAEVLTTIVQRMFARQVLTQRKMDKWVECGAWCAFFVMGNSLTYFIIKDAWVNSVIIFLLFLILFRFIYIDSFFSICMVDMFILVFALLAEFITAYGWMFFYKESWLSIQNDYGHISLMVISKFLLFIFFNVFILRIKKKKSIEVKFKEWVVMFVVPLVSILIVNLLFCNKNDMDNPMNLIMILLIFVINVLIYYIYEKTKIETEQNVREQVLREQSLYYIRQHSNNEKIWNEIKKFRHNTKEKYITERILLQNKEYEKLDELYVDALGMLDDNQNVSNTGNIYFDSIINYKAAIAKELGIQILLEIFVPADAKVDSEDINLCLGNILDNAIEATRKVQKESDKVIKMYIKSDRKNLWMEISNAYDSHGQNSTSEYKTTKDSVFWHGIGLSIVKNVVAKYNGDMKMFDNGNEFKVEILMYGVIE